MKDYEVLFLIVLYGVFGIFLLLLGFQSFNLGITEDMIIVAFYFLGLAVPLYFFVRFIMKRTFKAFKLIIVASIPMVTFIIIMIILIIQLGQALEHF